MITLLNFIKICIAVFIICFFVAMLGFLVGISINEKVGVTVAAPAIVAGMLTWVAGFIAVVFGKNIPFIKYDMNELHNEFKSAFKRKRRK